MCTKAVYTKKEAQTTLNSLRRGKIGVFDTTKRMKIKRRPARIYYCGHCRGWHLTSRQNFDN